MGPDIRFRAPGERRLIHSSESLQKDHPPRQAVGQHAAVLDYQGLSGYIVLFFID
jgi:hypothetical protein